MIIAGTGHRPKYLPCKYNENHPWYLSYKARMEDYITKLNPDIVISGMAIGHDIWLAETALEIGIDLHCYVPFKGQGGKWPLQTKQRYDKILSDAKHVIYCSDSYHRDCFKIRDYKMVDAANVILSLLSPEARKNKRSGTLMTVLYAERNNKKIYNLWED